MRHKLVLIVGCIVFAMQPIKGQKFSLFSAELRSEFPSVVYDFLERYLYEIDSLQRKNAFIDLKLKDDKVVFIQGSASTARQITPEMGFSLNKINDRYYEVIWVDTIGNQVLALSFPMQYELLLGKPKAEIEKTIKQTILESPDKIAQKSIPTKLNKQKNGLFVSQPVSNYYVESLNTATYFSQDSNKKFVPIFSSALKWESAANLFQGFLPDSTEYTLFIEQSLYGFKSQQFTVPLKKWLDYCESMQLETYFAVEEEREDGLKALLISQNVDLGFNHMISLIIPSNFIEKKNVVIKGKMNAYIPTQNVKDLYQQYVDKPKKKI